MTRLAEGILRVVAGLVPARQREAWTREWRGELAAAHDRGGARHRVLLAALEDAAVLRWRATEPGRALADLRFALRSLRRRPGFALAVILTLALGVGANVAVFSAVRGTLLKPLPYEDAGSVVLVGLAFGAGPDASAIPASEPEYWELREEATAFGDLAAYYASQVNLGGPGEPRRVGAAAVTENVLDVLGVEPALGRDFAPGDDGPASPRLALLSHGLWQREWGGDPGVLGAPVLVDERAYTVVGVLPADFEFPGAEVDVLYTLALDRASPGGRSSHWLSMVGRLAPGLDVPGARGRVHELVARWGEAFPGRHGPSLDHHPIRVSGVREAVAGDLRRPLALLGAAVALVLLVACLNVANLLLVRGDERRRELGVRTALGAGRPTLVRQMMMETAVLAVAGGVLGTGVAALGLQALPSYARELLPPNSRLALDGAVLLFAVGVTGAAALLFGLLPGWSATSGDVVGVLKEGGGRSGGGRRRTTIRRALVVLEVGVAVALLAGAGVLGRGFLRLTAVEPGFDPDGVVVMDFELTAGSYPEPTDVAAFHRELRDRIEALPGVARAGSIRTLPTRPWGGWETLDLPGRTPPSHDDDGWGWTVQYQVVDPGIFEALGIAVVEGRALRDSDGPGAPPVVVLNRTGARTLFGNDEPLGRELRLGRFPDNPNPVMTVVGVVDDVRQEGLDRPPPPQLYVARGQAGRVYGGLGTRLATLVVRSAGEPVATLRDVREAVRGLDPSLPVTGAGTLAAELLRSTGDRRFLAVLMSGFSVAALALGAVGLYGLLAYVVSGRTREIGIRFALGAERGAVLGAVVGEGLALVAVGALLGVGAALLGADLLEGLAFGVDVRDPLALAAAPVVLLLVGAAASWLPARRACRVEPATVLRGD